MIACAKHTADRLVILKEGIIHVEGTYEELEKSDDEGSIFYITKKNKMNKESGYQWKLGMFVIIGLVLLLQQYILLENRKIYLALHLS
jgi:ABC-type multidrug transport system ATPase subunit